MISSNDIRSGMTIILNGVVHSVIESSHHKPGKGHAFVRTKVKNMNTNSIFDHTFRAKEPVEQAIVDRMEMEYLYRDGNLFYFMDPNTYEQIPVSEEKISHLLNFLKENDKVNFTIYQGEVLSASLPGSILMTVVQAAPGAKGNTAQGATKPVVLDTGLEIQVPLFIKEGDIVKVDTEKGNYIERVTKK